MAEISKRPTGMSFSKNGSNYIFSWKIGDADYGDGQEFGYKLTYKKDMRHYNYVDVGTGTTKKSVLVSRGLYYPETSLRADKIWFAVRGNRHQYTTGSGSSARAHDPGWSKWATSYHDIHLPKTPSITATLDENLSNVTRFSWTVAVNENDFYNFNDVQWQSILVKDCKVSDGSKLTWKSTKLGWQTGNVPGGNNTYRDITEDTATLANGSYTRWFRVRARGMAGPTVWKYAKHVYAIPYRAKILSAVAKANAATNSFLVTVQWKAGASLAYPIDQTTVQYAIATPDAGLACPNGATWVDAVTIRDTADKDAAVFSVDDTLSNDQCLFVRVNTQHDSNVNYGQPYLASVGALATPSGVTVETNDTTHRATITATNNSTVSDSFLVVMYKPYSNPKKSFAIGIIGHGETSVTVQGPDWSDERTIAFGVYAAVGSYERVTRADGVYKYNVTAKMKSATTYVGGAVPTAPTNVSLATTDTDGTIRVRWGWSWAAADSAVISWADHEDAWESTDEPSEYTISRMYASQWYISGLEIGKVWYVRVRLVNSTGTDATYGPWSDIESIDLSAAPETPVLALSEGVISPKGTVSASWGYASEDGTKQISAEIREATVTWSTTTSGGESVTIDTVTVGALVAKVKTAQHVNIRAKKAGWTAGETHYLVCRVSSGSGKVSDWSDPAPIIIADPLSISIASTSLETITVPQDEDDETTRTVTALTEMPLTVTVTGAGAGGVTTVAIERAQDYIMDRPDESQFNGFEGETVALFSQVGEAQISIAQDDLIGLLDDGAPYRLTATVQDGYGQSAEASIDFEVHWSHQAVVPQGTAETLTAGLAVKITPVAPTGYAEGDTCDIYRLSADTPELIYKDAAFGTAYVDPYPALGATGGHRLVFKTVNGDYITEDNTIAWLDLGADEGDNLDLAATVIDFGNARVILQYNMEISHGWGKDFQQTKYLGGAVQGDWNPAVERTSSVSATTVVTEEQDLIDSMRRLAEYPGICHVRTADGSSYAADVQVSEKRTYEQAGKMAVFDLSITRVDPEGFDGMTYAQWTEA